MRKAQEYEKNLLIYTITDNDPNHLLKVCRAGEIDGVILFSTHYDHQTIESLLDEKFPFVVMGREILDERVSYVVPDYYDGSYQASQYLIDLGHRRIAFTTRPELTTANVSRLNGYLDALKNNNIAINDDLIVETITPKGKLPITLKYREISILLKDTGHNATVLSLENYRLSGKGELSEDEIIALKIILNREIKIAISKYPFDNSELFRQLKNSKEFKELENDISSLKVKLSNGEKVKTKLQETERKLRKIISSAKGKYRKIFERNLNKDTSSKYYKYKNSAQLRFGWTLTVHKSMSYKWDEIIFNIDQGENRGKTNENYFKWVYTGLTRAKSKVSLINYKPISPLLKIEYRDANTGIVPDNNIYFIANTEARLSDLDTALVQKFNFNEETPFLLQVYQLINSKLERYKISIHSINHPNYQEQYKLEGSNGEIATISFYYNNNGRIRKPSLMQATPSEFGDEVIEILTSDNEIKDFSFIKDKWREKIYTEINEQLIKTNSYFNYIIQVPYKDTIKINNDDSELIVDMYYDGDCFFSSIFAAATTSCIGSSSLQLQIKSIFILESEGFSVVSAG